MAAPKSTWQRILLIVGGLLFVGSCIGFAALVVRGPGARLVERRASPTAVSAPPSTPMAIPVPTPTPRPDADSDGLPDESDLCPALVDPFQNDLDGDGWGDSCDIDIDGDGQANINDACPFDTGRFVMTTHPKSSTSLTRRSCKTRLLRTSAMPAWRHSRIRTPPYPHS